MRPIRKDDHSWIIDELDREYFLHDAANDLADRWVKQKFAVEKDRDGVLILLSELHQRLQEVDPEYLSTETGQTIKVILSTRNVLTRRNKLRSVL